MPFRRVNVTGIGADPPPYFARWCWEPACCSGNTTWVRTKLITTFGGVKSCGLDIQGYDPSADPGRYSTITGNWTRTWKKWSDNSVVKTCAMELTVSMDGPSFVKTVGEACDGSTDDSTECESPGVCGTPPGCYYSDSVVTYEGSGEITAGELADGARTRQTINDSGWGDWEKGYASIIGGGHQARDTRGIANVSFTETAWEIEFGGMVREHKITWIETERPLPTGTATTSERSLHITGPGVYSLSLVAAPNTSKTMGNTLMLQFPIP